MKEIKIPKDTKLAMFILAVLVVAFIAMNLSDMEKLKINAVRNQEIQMPASADSNLDMTIVYAFGLITAFVILLLAVYFYEKNSLMEPLHGRTFKHKTAVRSESSKSANKSRSSGYSFTSLFESKKPNKYSFDAYASSISTRINRKGFNAVEASEVLGEKFKALSSEEQRRKLAKFLEVHRKIENSLK